MVYIPNPADPTRPLDTDPAASAANEFRTLKAYIQTVLATAGIGGLNMFRRNLLQNGQFQVDQRKEGAATSVTTQPYVADRWFCYNQSVATKTGQSVANTLGGGEGFMLDLNTTVGHAVAAADFNNLVQCIEGNVAAQLQFGGANAKAVSVSFIVSSPIAGVHAGALQNFNQSRSYVFTYNVPVANTPTAISINNIPGDQVGVWKTDTSTGVEFSIDLGSGINFEDPVGAGAWHAGNYTRIAGAANTMGTVGHFKITGVQIEVGQAASQFEFLDYSTVLQTCQRYYYKTFPYGTVPAQAGGINGAMTTIVNAGAIPPLFFWQFPVPLRVAPTYTAYNPVNANAAAYNYTTAANDGTAFTPVLGTSLNKLTAEVGVGSIAAAGQLLMWHFTASSEFL